MKARQKQPLPGDRIDFPDLPHPGGVIIESDDKYLKVRHDDGSVQDFWWKGFEPIMLSLDKRELKP